MAEGWAKNDWLSSDAITHTRLNNIGNSQRTIGYGEAPGSVTVNANSNHIANLGTLTLGAAGGFGGGTPSLPDVRSVTDLNTGVHFPGSDVMSLCTNGVERMRLLPTGRIDSRFDTAGRFGTAVVSLADDASSALEALLPGGAGTGILLLCGNSSATVYGSVALRGGLNIVTEIDDPFGSIAPGDADGFLCIIADGDGTYTIKNRLGTTQNFALVFMGFA